MRNELSGFIGDFWWLKIMRNPAKEPLRAKSRHLEEDLR